MNHYSNFNSKELLVKITEIKKQDSAKTTVIAEVVYCIDSNRHLKQSQGLIYINAYSKLALNKKIEIDHIYLVPNTSKIPDAPLKPWDFDFKHYLKLNLISHVLRIKKPQMIDIKVGNNAIKVWAEKAKQKSLSILRNSLKNPTYYGIAEGLLVGYREDIDPEVNKGFTNTGTVHILSTSGMHVALIFTLLKILTAFLKSGKKQRATQFIIIVSGLWFYAFMTGLGPSIIRACITLCIAGFGQLLDRKTNTINLVLATAFFQLIVSPLELFQPAFQLSYSAVLGILTLHPILSKLWQPKNRWLIHIRDLCSVSTAAQLFTFPFTCYYFGTFPIIFLLANLILIPLSTVILYGTILLLAIYYIPFCNSVCSYILNGLIFTNNKIAISLGNWEYSNITGLHITLKGAIVLGLAIFTITAAIHYRSSTFLKLSVICLALFITSYKVEKQDIILSDVKIYEEPKKNIIYLIKGTRCFIVLNTKGLTTKVNMTEVKMKIKNRLGIEEISVLEGDKLFVTTNLMIIPHVGLQFFDNLMTLK